MSTGAVVTGIVLECVLCVLAYQDIKSRKLSGIVLVVSGACGLFLSILFRPLEIKSLCGGVGIGLLMLLVSKLTGGGIGVGDGFVLCVTGLYRGFWVNLILLFVALLFAAVWGIGLIIIKKAGRRSEMPFVPFLFTAHTIILVCG